MDLFLNQFYVSILNIKPSGEKSEVNIINSMGNSAFTITISMVKIMKKMWSGKYYLLKWNRAKHDYK